MELAHDIWEKALQIFNPGRSFRGEPLVVAAAGVRPRGLPERASHKNRPLEKSLEYIDRIFRDYLAYSGLNSRKLEGKRVLEVGPGDNLGVALKFLAAGAAQVVSIDRFFPHRDPNRSGASSTALRETLTPAEKSRFDEAVDLSMGVRFHPEKLQYLYGCSRRSKISTWCFGRWIVC